mmetsp:Transcript_12057/g.32558  ORF Transcript_12057/g.32558 Transcript_12057/m.32558 type:complete len:257 (+) Transcript_12057:1865-2635(+)
MMLRFDSVTSLITFLRRSSNSPRYLVPDRRAARSRRTTFFPWSNSGTSPVEMRMARPSAMAVFPTPGSPIRTGLFFCRRARIWMVRSTSGSRPTSGSSAPSAANAVRSLLYSSSTLRFAPGWRPFWAPSTRPSLFCRAASCKPCRIKRGTSFGSAPSFAKTLPAFADCTFISASKMCAVSICFELNSFASCTPAASTSFAADVKGISIQSMPCPRPRSSSTAFRASVSVTPRSLSTLATIPELSATTPIKSISVPT